MTPHDTLKERVLASAAERRAPTRGEARSRARVAYSAAAAAMAVVFFGAGGVEHSRGRPLVYTLGIAAGATAIALAATAGAFSRSRSMLGRSTRVLATIAVLVPLATFGWLVVWNGHYLEPFSRVGYRCLALTLAMASAPLMAMLTVRRGTVVRAPRTVGATIGAAVGAWAGVGVDLWCPLTDPKHVAFGHVLPLLLLVGVGALAGHLSLRMRARR